MKTIEDRLKTLKVVGIVKDFYSYGEGEQETWVVWGPDKTAFPNTKGFNEQFDGHDMKTVLTILEAFNTE